MIPHAIDRHAAMLLPEWRAKGVTEMEARARLRNPVYFAGAMVRAEDADGFVGGVATTTADTVRFSYSMYRTARRNHDRFELFPDGSFYRDSHICRLCGRTRANSNAAGGNSSGRCAECASVSQHGATSGISFVFDQREVRAILSRPEYEKPLRQ
jgi:hypothetical protein